MAQNVLKKIIKIDGMTCASCELRIENTLKKMSGVIKAKVKLNSSSAFITYDKDAISLEDIIKAIEKLHYSVKDESKASLIDYKKTSEIKQPAKDDMSINQLIGVGIIVLAVYMIIKNTVGFNFIPEVDQSMGYGILFIVGLLTSFHCVAMCGGINLSQCMSYKFDGDQNSRFSKLKPSLLYNAGRVTSYTVIGGIVGALGSAISFSGTAKGIVAIVSGIFMVIMGLNILNIFPWLRRLNPRMPKIFGRKIYNNRGQYGPYFVGLLNGLMPCGPLQSMQLYALGTGSFIAGATSMFLFSVGTVPLMFGFGAFSSYLSGKFTQKMMKVSALLVMMLGIVMVNRGMSLSGLNIFAASSASSSIAKIEGDVQVVTTELESGSYSPIVVQKGIPVRWTIKVADDDLNGCNNPVTIPKYELQKKLVVGENVIEFMPDEEGNITYTCWMGMISSNIKVVSDLSNISENDIQKSKALDLSGIWNKTQSKNNIPTDNIEISDIIDDRQEVTVIVDDYEYTPSVIVLQRGIKAKIKFDAKQLNNCNNKVVFPEYNGQLDLENGQTETPYLTPEQDFTFQCWMGMINGYVKVVDDINDVDLEQIKSEVQNYEPPAGSRGCH